MVEPRPVSPKMRLRMCDDLLGGFADVDDELHQIVG